MIVIKLQGKSYESAQLEANSKIVKMWYVLKQVRKEKIIGKYHTIEDCDRVMDEYNEIIGTVDPDTRKF